MNERISGVLPVMHMPYREDFEIDYDILGAQVEYAYACGANGIVFALASELTRLTHQERRQAAQFLVQAGKDRGSVLISVGAESTFAAVEFARHAEEIGATAIMATPPMLTALDEAQLRGYYGALLEAVSLPLVVQDASSYLGQPMSAAFQASLFADYGERVLFKPEAEAVGPVITALQNATQNRARIFEGSGGKLLVESYRRGLSGTMPGTDLLEAIVALWRALEADDEARVYALSPLVSAIVGIGAGLDGYLAVEKHLLVRRGLFKNRLVRGPVGFTLDAPAIQEADRLFDRLQAVLNATESGRRMHRPGGTSAVIRRVRATPVRVPAKPDSLNSAQITDEDADFLAKFKVGNSWADFVNQPKWILEIETQDGLCGIGETYRSVEREEIEPALNALVGREALSLNWRTLPCEQPRVYDAVEAAVLDLAGKRLGMPVHQLLGGACRDRIECSGWTGRRTPEDAARKAKEALERGHRVFKFKCSDTDPIRDWCARIRETCGERIRLLLDPNQRWNDVPTTLRLMEGVPAEMMFGLEDPVDRQDYAAFREIKQRLGIPLFIHISLPYRHQGQRAEDALRAVREQCADGFNFNGPMFDFVQLAGLAALDGKPCWHGSEVDLGILEVAALHACAAAPGCTIPSDIFGELVRVDDLIEPGIRFEQGHALVPAGPGLGVELDREALARFQIGPALETQIR